MVHRAAQAAVAALGWEVILIIFLILLLFAIPVLGVLAIGLIAVFTTPEMPPEGTLGQIEGVQYADIINTAVAAASAKYDVDLDPALIAGMIQQESNWDPKAESPAGAQGLMQIMPFNLNGIDPYNPRQNIFRGTEIIASHLKTYDGDVEKALAAYNAGPGAVSKNISNGGDGIPQNGETPEYVEKVLGYQKTYQSQVKKGEMVAVIGDGTLGMPAEAQISCDYHCYDDHGGIDFSGQGNRAIYAAADGQVVRKEDLNGRSYGTLVVIDHGGGLETAYAHMEWDDILVEAGQVVKRGEPIGTMGNNGKSSGVHLHFEVRLNGERVDPTPYLQSKSEGDS